MNRYEFYGNINTYRKNQTNKENKLTHCQNPDGTFNEAVSKEEQSDKINSKVTNFYQS